MLWLQLASNAAGVYHDTVQVEVPEPPENLKEIEQIFTEVS